MTFLSSSAQSNCDSLKTVWSDQSIADTLRLGAAKGLSGNCFLYSYPDSSIYYGNQYLELAEANLDSGHIVSALVLIGIAHFNLADNIRAKEVWERGLSLSNEPKVRLILLVNLANAESSLSNIKKAIQLYTEALAIADKMDNENRQATILLNIGTLYYDMQEYENSLNYWAQAYNYFSTQDDEPGLRQFILVLYNMIEAYVSLEDYDKALEYADKMMIAARKKSDNYYYNMSLSHLSRSSVLMAMKNWESALGAQDSCLYYSTLMNEKNIRYSAYRDKARTYLSLNQTKAALQFGLKAYDLSLQRDLDSRIKSSQLMYDIYKALGRTEDALHMHEEMVQFRDSQLAEENEKEIIRQEYKYQYEKEAFADSLEAAEAMRIQDLELEAEKARSEQYEVEKKQQRQGIYFLVFGLIAAVAFVVFVYNRLKLTRKQNVLIIEQKNTVEQQKLELEHVNAELSNRNITITHSIMYAKKIQKALLPTENAFKEYFDDAFIYFNPKDIVSGDFYWGYHNGDELIFTAADCTGHGVPGAFMSLVGTNILDKIVGEMNISSPDKILWQLSIELQNRLQKDSDEIVKDGMDLVICSINLKTKQLTFAGAYNPLYLIRNGELTQYKTDRFQLGNAKHMETKSISLHSIDLKKGDQIYLFTDGFADQKGGPHKKKYYYQPFRDLLLKQSANDLSVQRMALEEEFAKWRKDMEQMDDVLVMGLKI